jgi:hypothetical protein
LLTQVSQRPPQPAQHMEVAYLMGQVQPTHIY